MTDTFFLALPPDSKIWYPIALPYSWPWDDALVTITLLLQIDQETEGRAVWKWNLDGESPSDLILDPSDWPLGESQVLPVWGLSVDRDNPRILTIWREPDARDTINPPEYPYVAGMILSLEEQGQSTDNEQRQ